jgi:hypothetical protein
MRPAGRQHSVTIPITPTRTSSDSLRIVSAVKQAAPATKLASDSDDAVIESHAAAEHGRAENGHAANGHGTSSHLSDRHRHITVAIRQRIESRLGARVRDLAIRIRGNTVILEGRCATFYTKQLAQHAALGVLEDEQLDNAIVVTM